MNHNAIINIAKAQLGLEEDDYRAVLTRVTGKASLKLMSSRDKGAVIDELKRLGFKSGKSKAHPVAPRSDLRLVHVLWRLLGEAGVLTKPGRAGLNAFLRVRFADHWQSVPMDIDSMRDPDQIDAVIQALKQWCKREGIALDPQKLAGKR
ncbi:regulatory protein GemA [Oceaniglobus trochenteri]|uniref:regulatory protein GemA n=1 Tax=Oceaniglobus trochenteri TaxID=2763260 RepID=UPI001CFF5AE2|nr:regulatory protein GemA [Oceaniglobus trochenteri]